MKGKGHLRFEVDEDRMRLKKETSGAFTLRCSEQQKQQQQERERSVSVSVGKDTLLLPGPAASGHWLQSQN